MKSLKIHFFKSPHDEKPDIMVTIPLTTLRVAVQLLPKKAKSVLEKEGIDISRCSDLAKEKDLKGTIIEIENPSEKVVISIE
ncbi:MAG: hypothetical protein JRJ29_15780 [Deltaproteobacteria bacterium]|nr:hypothetical protein [Deltaproteobacteria bacterium]